MTALTPSPTAPVAQDAVMLLARPQRLPILVVASLVSALVGVLFGVTLFHASFGFALSYRQLLLRGDGRGVLAQLVMLAIATLLFAPLLIGGVGRGAMAPLALQAALGAGLFGIDMHLGSGCACGTPYTIGGGSSMMLFTLLTFSTGSFLGSLSNGLWQGLPRLEPVSLLQLWGWSGVLLQLLVLAVLAVVLWRWQRPVLLEQGGFWPRGNWPALLQGPWALVTGALALAVLNGLTVVLAGRPWGATWGFTLWAAKLAHWLGWDPSTSDFWREEGFASALQSGLLEDVTSMMNLGIVLGAALAASLVGSLSLRFPVSGRAVVASLIGGLLLGYGAWLAYGCNVGAYFSGIASTSLHGWLWIVFALLGTVIGVRLRPRFGLPN